MLEPLVKTVNYQGTTFFNVPLSGKIVTETGDSITVQIPFDVIQSAYVEQQWKDIRAKRDKLISESDWTQTLDSPLDEAKSAEFVAYRKTLREIPQTYSDPDLVVWPEKPTI
ncbi:tail assembly chaperone [Vibrio phage VPHZ6]|nr:tail assembly chaperone [Vibrio phage VPHZ6]